MKENGSRAERTYQIIMGKKMNKFRNSQTNVSILHLNSHDTKCKLMLMKKNLGVADSWEFHQHTFKL